MSFKIRHKHVLITVLLSLLLKDLLVRYQAQQVALSHPGYGLWSDPSPVVGG
jgi:hypothetical protein